MVMHFKNVDFKYYELIDNDKKLYTHPMYRLDWAKKVSLAAISLVAGSASFGLREN
jgi:hypothetical protein